jgi:hypothetical protein
MISIYRWNPNVIAKPLQQKASLNYHSQITKVDIVLELDKEVKYGNNGFLCSFVENVSTMRQLKYNPHPILSLIWSQTAQRDCHQA